MRYTVATFNAEGKWTGSAYFNRRERAEEYAEQNNATVKLNERRPSAETLKVRLRVSGETALAIRAAMELDIPDALKEIDRLLGGFGVEYIPTNRDRKEFFGACDGLEYVNLGDTYDTTIIFDQGRRTWRVCSWGDIVERDRRFRSRD